jgi:hypothetical protein
MGGARKSSAEPTSELQGTRRGQSSLSLVLVDDRENKRKCQTCNRTGPLAQKRQGCESVPTIRKEVDNAVLTWRTFDYTSRLSEIEAEERSDARTQNCAFDSNA